MNERAAGPDLRLLGLAAGAWLAVLAAIRVRPSSALLLGAVALGLAALTAACRRLFAARTAWFGVAVRVALPVLLGAGTGACATVAYTTPAYDGPVARLAADRALVRAELVLDRDPTPVRGGATGASWLLPVTLHRVRPVGATTGAVDTRVSVVAFGTGDRWSHLLPGQPLTVTARLSPPTRRDGTAATLSVRGPPVLAGRPPWYQRAAGHLRAGLRTVCRGLPDAPGGLLPGLVDGDTSTLDPVVSADFRTAGMTHLTAVSGSNLAIVLGFVLLLARWGRAGPRLAAVLGAFGTIGFVVLVRPDPSVLRAALMGGLGLLAMALHRPRAAVPGLAATSFLLVVTDPPLAAELGFVLSVLATLGLLLFAPPWRDALRRRRIPRGVAEVVAVSLAAHVACVPVIAGYTGTVGIAAVPANVLAEPAVAPATVLGLGAALLAPVSTTLAYAVAWLASWPCRWLVLVAHTAASAPAAVLPWPGGVVGGLLLAAVLLAFAALAGHRTARRVVLVLAVCVVVGVAPVRWLAAGWPPAGWVFVACDVGQGDGLVVHAAPGQAVVVDTGPEPTAIDRCLRQLGVRAVPLLVLTHDDADHVGGITGVFERRRVGAVAVSRVRGTVGGREVVERVAAAHGLVPFPAPPGWRYHAGAAELTVLAPPEPLTGTESDTNNNCIVLRVATAGVTLLLTGDAGPELQAELRRDGAPLHADVLKVAHHGSAHQDPGFTAAVRPRVAVVSVGAHNDYGQPNPAVLRGLVRAGVRVARTDQDGDVAVVVTARGLAVSRHGPAPGRGPP
ncbi:ComEC/Rec2 family competence protein [Actinocatenispora rupis]|uniref:Competence protein ComEC n=1 Tax=Actinocatenispora rupis TaxID=519421 RepID=A0A8J3NGG1_9ACTN|nr:ComEC/Rec2 family competence protein [Actinocatenispora rupis]GID14834.1 competence protein ComEC [Actinocatenispora rupis]